MSMSISRTVHFCANMRPFLTKDKLFGSIEMHYLDHISQIVRPHGNAMKNERDTHRESKSERFTRVAERRTVRVLTDLRLLGQCANRRSYEYSPEQVRKIFREIRRSLRAAEERFEDGRNTQFRLK